MSKEEWRSISSPDIIHHQGSAYLAELIFLNRDENLKNQPLFWQDKKYQNSFRGLIINLSKRLKYISFDIAYKVIVENKLTHINEEFDNLIIEELKK